MLKRISIVLLVWLCACATVGADEVTSVGINSTGNLPSSGFAVMTSSGWTIQGSSFTPMFLDCPDGFGQPCNFSITHTFGDRSTDWTTPAGQNFHAGAGAILNTLTITGSFLLDPSLCQSGLTQCGVTDVNVTISGTVQVPGFTISFTVPGQIMSANDFCGGTSGPPPWPCIAILSPPPGPTPQVVPEPGPLLLVASGLLFMRRRHHHVPRSINAK